MPFVVLETARTEACVLYFTLISPSVLLDSWEEINKEAAREKVVGII
jgi:hypothetical protein